MKKITFLLFLILGFSLPKAQGPKPGDVAVSVFQLPGGSESHDWRFLANQRITVEVINNNSGWPGSSYYLEDQPFRNNIKTGYILYGQKHYYDYSIFGSVPISWYFTVRTINGISGILFRAWSPRWN